MADVNGDGRMADLLDFLGPNAFLINKDGFKFEDMGRTSWAMGALFFDATNDGLPELYAMDMHSDMWTRTDPTGVLDAKVKYDTPRGETARGWKAVCPSSLFRPGDPGGSRLSWTAGTLRKVERNPTTSKYVE